VKCSSPLVVRERRHRALWLAACVLLASGCPAEQRGPRACGQGSATGSGWPPPVGRPWRLVSNGGFEAGVAPWFVPGDESWPAPVTVARGLARGGERALVAKLRGPVGARGQRKWGAMYELGSVPFPRRISFHYRVERWQAANAPQYVQLCVIVVNRNREVRRYTNFQVRYVLAGLDRLPYNSLGNTKFVMVRKGPPPLGRWVRFARDLHADFRRLWGLVPTDFEQLRLTMHVRYDAIEAPLAAPVAADVYFDDVFVGWPARRQR